MNLHSPVHFSDDNLKPFQALLLEESGMFLDLDRPDRLSCVLADRIDERGFESIEDYHHFLMSHPEGRREIQALIERVTIGETYFYRNIPQFSALREHVLPALVAERAAGSRILTVWSAGCSTGEEPYSLAMTILETIPSPESWTVSILATDINRDSLRKAGEAVYGPRSLRQLPAPWIDKYFHRQGDKYALKDSLKRRVRFIECNLAKDFSTLPGMQNIDVLFCRNVTIYFKLETTRQIVNQFADCLGDNGYLFIGEAETLWQISDRFKPVEFPQTMIYQKTCGSETAILEKPWVSFLSPSAMMEPVAARLTEKKEPTVAGSLASIGGDSSYEQGLEALRVKDYPEALKHFDAAVQSRPNNFLAHFAKASLLAEQQKYNEAIASLQCVIESDNLSSEAHHLMGALYQKTNRFEEAIRAFQAALYIDPGLSLTYFFSGMIYRYEQRFAKARRAFQNALKSLVGKPPEEKVRFSNEVDSETLRGACHRALEELDLRRPA